MHFTITVTPGDGIGPEVVSQGISVLEALGRSFGHQFSFTHKLVGGCAIDRFGQALEPGTLEAARKSDAVLLGAVGGPKWDDSRASVRPEDGLLALRKELGLFANLRPVKCYPQLIGASPLREHLLEGVDLLIVRELTGGLYFGRPKRRWQTARGRRGVDTMAYTEQEIERVLRTGFELARSRRKKLTSVDKANILETSRLWRELAIEVSSDYPQVKLEHQLVDTAAMRLVSQPADFDVMVTENTFGDILTDEAAVLTGSLGMLPSASLGGRTLIARRGRLEGRTFGLYEPVHGSAPDIAGQDKANPIATILSLALMLRYSLGLEEGAQRVEQAVEQTLSAGYRTPDIMSEGCRPVGTREMGELIVGHLRA